MLYKDRDVKSCLERRDKTPSSSRRPVPGQRGRLGVPQIEQQLTRPVLIFCQYMHRQPRAR
jgi:hypothetical protein